ncbi:3-oxoacyl-ACP reductase FabG [Mesorhizobium sp. KR2-14]|uniref:3-oxoacyl-ACP reductase FabG n=1 Tax=Mesorhizobium sp. KR2-14 TaxID=3156610 RepID=UPI0032B325B2
MKPDVVIVTGAGRGIGAAIAQRLACDGWKVAGLDRVFGEEDCPHLAFRHTVDVADYEAVEAAVGEVEKAVGPVGGLVNNAGITRDAICHRMDPADFRAVLDVNLVGPFNLCRALLGGMRERSFGRIVNISSINALRGQAGQANYAAAKAGLIALTKSIALENASKGITANCIAPGFVRTDMTDAMRADIRDAEVARIPVGRIGAPEDIASAASFLMSDETGFITGEVLSVNGGQFMR